MKIVNRKDFMRMPEGTIYSEFEPSVFDGLYVKVSREDDLFYNKEEGRLNDWVCVPLIDGFIKDSINNSFNYKRVENFEFNLDCSVRDGLYEEKQLFAVYDKNDILKLIAKLSYSFLEPDIKYNSR